MAARVLIVGAGPVGLTMAVELTRYGVPVRIIDKVATRTDKSKALVIWGRTLELLRRAGYADALIGGGREGEGRLDPLRRRGACPRPARHGRLALSVRIAAAAIRDRAPCSASISLPSASMWSARSN